MEKKQTLSIIICTLIAFGSAMPVDVPLYKQLGYKKPSGTNSSGYNNNVVTSTNRLGGTTIMTTTTPTPQFEYALLGQDPKDQHWYRVSLTPTDNKSGYRAQFATRRSPPYDAEQAHKHDKTIKELLNFLENSEEHNLLKVYGQILDSEDYNDQNAKEKRNGEKFEIDVGNDLDIKTVSKTDGNRPLALAGELTVATPPTNSQNGSDSTMFKNFVYFIKGLK
ncbi:GH11096 [Drosophila grimshawi]|uniref:GH11096 n=2 Tax=Drosophila grimshawi TaxID=7222 RepID=B4JCU3_DROGR|nr:GH11096 [Drosophila grimshawi]